MVAACPFSGQYVAKGARKAGCTEESMLECHMILQTLFSSKIGVAGGVGTNELVQRHEVDIEG